MELTYVEKRLEFLKHEKKRKAQAREVKNTPCFKEREAGNLMRYYART